MPDCFVIGRMYRFAQLLIVPVSSLVLVYFVHLTAGYLSVNDVISVDLTTMCEIYCDLLLLICASNIINNDNIDNSTSLL